MKGLILSFLMFFSLIMSSNGGFVCPEGDGGAGTGGEGDDGKGGDDGAGTGDDDNGKKGDDDGGSDDNVTISKKELKKLRDENASRRVKNKDLEGRLSKLESGLKSAFSDGDDDDDGQGDVDSLTNNLNATEFENGVLQLALENQIPAEKLKYLKYRLVEAGDNIGDDEELPEEVLAQIIQEVKGQGQGKGNTAPGKEDGKQAAGEGGEEKADYSKVTAESFVKLGESEKNKMFLTDRASYDSLYKEAREKKLFRY